MEQYIDDLSSIYNKKGSKHVGKKNDYRYDEDGDITKYDKKGQSMGTCFAFNTYRYTTSEEHQMSDIQYKENIRIANDEYNTARMELHTASRSVPPLQSDMSTYIDNMLRLNQAVLDADIKLTKARYPTDTANTVEKSGIEIRRIDFTKPTDVQKVSGYLTRRETRRFDLQNYYVHKEDNDEKKTGKIDINNNSDNDAKNDADNDVKNDSENEEKYIEVIPDDKNQFEKQSDSPLQLAKGTVYIGSKNMRGKWAEKPYEKIKTVDVTSAQGKTSQTRIDFSPMTKIKGGYKGYWNFEAYWQSGKVYEGIPEATTKRWWKAVKEPKRRYPAPKGTRVLYAKWDNNPERMDWITSRKKVYVPEYFNLMKNTKSAIALKEFVDKGNDMIIYDFDGPRTKEGNVSTLEITVDNLREKLNDKGPYPFGHGYIVAAWLKNIHPREYIN